MQEGIIDENLDKSEFDSSLSFAIKWWEKRRIWFNLSVGLAGLFIVLMQPFSLLLFDIIGIVAWGVFANILYSLGFLLEVFDRYYFKGKIKMFRFRLPLFIIGVLAYTLVTLLFSINYFFVISPHL